VLFLAIPCPLRHSPENNLRKLLRFCRDPDPNAERLERFIWRGFYYRVSTGKQDIEMPAQRAAVEAFLNGGGWKIIGEEVEVETGTKTDAQRPKLAKALAIAKKHKATLVIAKLDRLARDTHFNTGLQKSVCCATIKNRPLILPHSGMLPSRLIVASFKCSPTIPSAEPRLAASDGLDPAVRPPARTAARIFP
jgi:hypothetical protein